MDTLPPELLEYTFSFVHYLDLATCERVSKRWHSLISRSTSIWTTAAIRQRREPTAISQSSGVTSKQRFLFWERQYCRHGDLFRLFLNLGLADSTLYGDVGMQSGDRQSSGRWKKSAERGQALKWIENRWNVDRMPLSVRNIYAICDIEMLFDVLCRHNGMTLTALTRLLNCFEAIPDTNLEALAFGSHRLEVVTVIEPVVTQQGNNRLRTLETSSYYVVFTPTRLYSGQQIEDPPVFSQSGTHNTMTLLSSHFSDFVYSLLSLGLREAESGRRRMDNAERLPPMLVAEVQMYTTRFNKAMEVVLRGGRDEQWEQLEEELNEEWAQRRSGSS
ncbi:hypothetical protein M427DRAFT_61701 [Gonapodya prolifera JEL478]|uniref:F-box domain-containing protein n=1 Tax=Gonapodya prolifera (strain JEL478) TaxID=1344416 RepID=A0A139A2I2_GONPJ|nr:hypothetical protein M427DRAFT_61701 [Gonapodya prolifera JEL478]|eukprot:KXS10755.1 hypothetical protein M427DRAFT_61701 [Gonapodya prolifera JEL478]